MNWFTFIIFQFIFGMLLFLLQRDIASFLLGALIGVWFWILIISWRTRQFFNWLKSSGLRKTRFNGVLGDFQYFWQRQQKNHQRKERKLTRRLRDLQAANQASPDGVLLLRRNWCIEWCNEVAASHLGLDMHGDVGKILLQLVRNPDFLSFCTVMDFTQSINIDSPAQKESGSTQRLRLSIRIRSYGRGRYLLISRDISQQIQAEVARRDFIANVSHEIRTPLTIFTGVLETMLSLPLDTREQAKYLQKMQKQAHRMEALVQDLLKLSRLEDSPLPGLHDSLDVREILQHCFDDVVELSTALSQRTNQKPHQIAVHYYNSRGEGIKLFSKHDTETDALPSAQGILPGREREDNVQQALAYLVPKSINEIDDKKKNLGILAASDAEIFSAFFNLLSNAVRYTPSEGGAIQIIWQWWVDGSASFSVKDNGPGIANEHLPRITERFYRIDRSRSRQTGGTGLGLAIVKHVIARHGAELSIESIIGQGSTFRIDFPATRLRTPESIEEEERLIARRERTSH